MLAARIVFVAVGLAGCSGSDAARNLSRETLVQVVEYEEQVRDLSRALRANYRQSSDDYNRILLAAAETRRRTVQANLANDAADATIKDGFSDKDFREYIGNVITRSATATEDLQVLRVRQIAAQKEALGSAALDETELSAVRSKLEQLQREPSLSDRAGQLRPFLETAMQALQGGNNGSEVK